MIVRDATAAEIERFYGAAPAVPVRMFALDDGDVIGLAGLAWLDDGVFAVSWLLDPAKEKPMAAASLSMALLELIEQCDQAVYARPDPDEPRAATVLRYLGFEPQGEVFAYRTDLPGRFYLRHARRAPGSVSADAGRTGALACSWRAEALAP